MMRKRRSTCKPRLEVLEDRLCLSPPAGGGTITNPALVFVANSRNSVPSDDLFLTTANGAATKQITSDGASNLEKRSPAWSPDGTRIAFFRGQSSGASTESGGLYSIKTDGTGLALLYDFLPSGSGNPSALSADTEHIDWSPDGKKIAFAAWGGVEGLTLRILDVAAGTVHTLQPLTSLNARAYTPDWSPDQDPVTPGYQGKLAFTGFLDQDTNSDLYVLDVTIGADGTLTTGTVTNLTNTPSISEGAPAWSPDGQSIAFNLVINGQSTVSKMRADGTGVQTLAAAVSGQTAAWSPDGQYLAYWSFRAVPPSSDKDLFRIRADGSGNTNLTNSDKRAEWMPDWNPKWVNDLGSPLMAASTGSGAKSETLTRAQVAPLLAEARARWQAAGVDTTAPVNVQIQITNLGGTTLGMASGHTIYLDDNAAGWGWFVDPTPHNDSEFTTPGNQGEQHRMDLLTVVMHELGHVLGYEHEATGVMQDTLSAGVRELPNGSQPRLCPDAAEWIFAVLSLEQESKHHPI